MNEGVQAAAAPRPVGHYPHARRVGDLLFLSGIGPRDPATNAIPNGIEAQTRAVFANVRAVLEAALEVKQTSGLAPIPEIMHPLVALAGAGLLRLMFVTVLPNCMAPLIVHGTMSFSSAILDIAALGFLGLGVQPPTPEWGTMLASARDYISNAWWIITMPGVTILLSVLAINLMGDGLRDALDPKLKRVT